MGSGKPRPLFFCRLPPGEACAGQAKKHLHVTYEDVGSCVRVAWLQGLARVVGVGRGPLFGNAIASNPVSIEQPQLKWVNYNTAVLCFESISSNLKSVNHGQYLTLDFSPLPLPLNSMLGLHVARIERAKKK
jgi:hypothetical protein